MSTARAGELAKLHANIPVERYRSLVGHWISRWFRAPRPAPTSRRPSLEAGQVAVTFGGHATVIARYQRLGDRVRPDARALDRRRAPRGRAGLAPVDFDGSASS